MKPGHFKEFNAEHAQAGAPYCQRNGLAARIGIWDKLNSHCLSGVMQDSTLTPTEIDSSWDIKGQWLEGEISNCDLVMLPLGMCEGKPVFVGDELMSRDRGLITVTPMFILANECTWPRKAPVMPRWFDNEYDNDVLVRAMVIRPAIEAYWKALDEFNGVPK